MKCMKHPEREATRILEINGTKYTLCPDCAWAALKNGESLLCVESNIYVHLTPEEVPVFSKETP